MREPVPDETGAALALTEAVTRLSDRLDPVSDEVWDEAARHYDEPALAALLMQIGLINVFNRLNAATTKVTEFFDDCLHISLQSRSTCSDSTKLAATRLSTFTWNLGRPSISLHS